MEWKVPRAWMIGYWIVGFVIFVVFTALGQSHRGVVAAFSFGAVALAARIRWDLRNETWYRVVFSILTAVHGIAIFAIDWSLHLKPTILYAPLVIADFSLIVFLVFFLERSLQNGEG